MIDNITEIHTHAGNAYEVSEDNKFAYHASLQIHFRTFPSWICFFYILCFISSFILFKNWFYS